MTNLQNLPEFYKDAKSNPYRFLLEIEPSGRAYVWCEKENKRSLLRLIRKYKIRVKIVWKITDDTVNYEKHQSLVILEEDKGPIAKRF